MGKDVTVSIAGALISGIFSALFTWVFIHRNTAKECTRERFEKVLSPIMELIQPILYKPLLSQDDFERLEKCRGIYQNNIPLAGRELMFHFSQDLRNPTCFHHFCSELDWEYRRCCQMLGIPCCSWKQFTRSMKTNKKLAHYERTINYIMWILTAFSFAFCILSFLVSLCLS